MDWGSRSRDADYFIQFIIQFNVVVVVLLFNGGALRHLVKDLGSTVRQNGSNFSKPLQFSKPQARFPTIVLVSLGLVAQVTGHKESFASREPIQTSHGIRFKFRS